MQMRSIKKLGGLSSMISRPCLLPLSRVYGAKPTSRLFKELQHLSAANNF